MDEADFLVGWIVGLVMALVFASLAFGAPGIAHEAQGEGWGRTFVAQEDGAKTRALGRCWAHTKKHHEGDDAFLMGCQKAVMAS